MRRVARLLSSLALIGALFCACAPSVSPEYAAEDQVAGKSQEALAADWIQWLNGMPQERQPNRDLTGERCTEDNDGPVFFLSGLSGGGHIHRVCKVPADKPLFFPIITMTAFPPDNGSPNCDCTCEHEQDLAGDNPNTAQGLFVELDGKKIANLASHHLATSECFALYGRFPHDDTDYIGFPAATDGYWLALRPLRHGRHTLHYKARFDNPDDLKKGSLAQDIEYELVVR